MPTDPKLVRDQFLAAAELGAVEREAYLTAHCGDAELRAAVERLLAAHDQPASVPNRPGLGVPLATGELTPDPADAPPQVATTDYHPNAEPGAVIAGRYTLQEKIGEGGMGEVWVSKQTEPVKRKVALKLIKAGMDTKAVLQRFEAERQALAMMDHPNIARVLDGGMTPDRRPFFVMELVNGLPLTRFCDEAKLGIRKRLELFAAICQAVQHAHQKGIIHRDLKPSNILVTVIDARPVPKVIDFGVAKAIGGKLLDESLSTQFGAVVGTLEYMAPEQAGFSGNDIETRADIYSLGVILYELLTGLRPIDAKRLKKAAYTEMIRIIQEEEPSKPSTRLSTDEALPSLAASRHIEPKKLMALLRGDLDWVVMKCLEKQRERRYETANALARDVQRYLADEVVEARPPSTGYRLKKFVRRHQGQVLAACLVLFALLAGIGGTTFGLIRANQSAEAERLARLDAQEKEKVAVAAADKEREARLEAERQRKFAEAISRFVQDDFLALTSVEGQDRFGGEGKEALSKDTTLRDLLDRASEKLRARKDLDPQIEADLCWIVGVNYRGAGDAEKGIGFLQRAVQLRSDLLGRDHAKTLNAMNSLALAYGAAGKADQALALFEETLKLRKTKPGPDYANTLMSMNNLAMAYNAAGKLNLALPLYEETLKLRKAKLGPEHPDTLTSMNNLAAAYQNARKLDLAVPLFEETIKLQKSVLGPEHPNTLTSMNNLAVAYKENGKLDLALPLFEEALKLRKAKLGPEHPATLTSMNNLARAYQTAAKLDLALPLFEETLKLGTAKLGPEHPDTLNTMGNLAVAYQAAGKLDLALPLFEETLRLQKAKLGSQHPNTLISMNNLAVAYKENGKLDLALPLFEEALKLRKAKLGPEHPDSLNAMGNLGRAYCDTNQGEKAAATLKGFIAGRRKRSKPDHHQFAGLLAQVSLDLLKCRQFAAVEEILRECLAIREKTQPDVWSTFNTKSLLGGALLGQKKYADAEPLLLAGYEGMKKREAKIPAQGKIRLTEALERLVQLYEAMEKKDDAAKWRKELEATNAAQKKVEKKP
jgi:Tfp pilus assembly protein PilF